MCGRRKNGREIDGRILGVLKCVERAQSMEGGGRKVAATLEGILLQEDFSTF